MKNIKAQTLSHSVSVIALLSLFIVGGISSLNASTKEALHEERLKQWRIKNTKVIHTTETVEIMTPGPVRERHPSKFAEDPEEIHRMQEAVKKALEDQSQTEEEAIKKITECGQKVQEKEAEIKIVERDVSQLVKSISDLEKKLEKSEKENHVLKDQATQLYKSIALKESEIRRAKKQEQVSSETLTKLEQDLNELKEKEKELKVLDQQTSQSVKTLEKELHSAQQAKESALKKQEALEANLGALRTDLDLATQSLGRVNQKMAGLTEELIKMQAADAQARQALISTFGHGGLGSPFTTPGKNEPQISLFLEQGVDSALEGIGNILKDRFAKASARVDSLTLALEELNKEKEVLEKKLGQQHTERAAQEEQFRREAEEKEQKIIDLQRCIQDLENHIQELENNRDCLKGELENESKALLLMRQEKEKLEQELITLKATQAITLARMDELEKELKIITQSKEVAENTAKSVGQILKEVEKAAAEDKRVLTSKITDLEKLLEENKKSASADQQALKQAHQSRISEMATAHQQALEKLEFSIKEKEKTLTALQEDFDTTCLAAEAQKSDYEARLEQARKDLVAAHHAAAQQAQNLEESHRLSVQKLHEEYEKQKAKLNNEYAQKEQSLETQLKAAEVNSRREVTQFNARLSQEKSAAQEAQLSLEKDHARKIEQLQQQHASHLQSIKDHLVAEKEAVVTQIQASLNKIKAEALRQEEEFVSKLELAETVLKKERDQAEIEKIALEKNYTENMAAVKAQHEEEIKTLENITLDLQQELKDARALLDQVRTQAVDDGQKAQLKFEALKMKLQEEQALAEQNYKDLVAQHESFLKAQNQAYTKAKDLLQADLDDKLTLLEQKEKLVAENNIEIETLSMQIASMQGTIKNQEDIIADHEDTLEAFEEELEKLSNEKSQLLANKAAIQIAVEGLTQEISVLLQQQTLNRSTIASLEGQLQAQKHENKAQRDLLQKELDEEMKTSKKLLTELEQAQNKNRRFESELVDMEVKLKALEDKWEKACSKLDKEKSDKERVEEQLKTTANQLAEAEEKLAELESLNSSLNSNIQLLEEAQSELRKRQREENHKFHVEKSDLEEKLGKVQRTVSDLEQQLKNAHSDIERILEFHAVEVPDAFMKKITALKNLIGGLKKNEQAAKESLVETEEHVKRLSTEKQKLGAALDSLETKSKAQSQNLAQTEQKLSNEEKKVASLAQEIEQKNKELELAETNQQSLKNKILNQEEIIETLGQEINTLKHQKESLDFEIKELKEQLQLQKDTANGLNTEVKKLTSTVSASSRKLRVAEDEMRSVEDLLNEHDRKMQCQRKKTAEMEAERDQLKSELEKTKSKLMITEEEASNRLQQFADFVNPQLEKLQEEILQQKASLESAEIERSNLHQRLQEHQQALEEERKQHVTLKKEYADVLATRQSALAKINELKTKLTLLSQENEKLKVSIVEVKNHKLKIVKQGETPLSLRKKLAGQKYEFERIRKQNSVLESIPDLLMTHSSAASPASWMGDEGVISELTSPQSQRSEKRQEEFKTPTSKPNKKTAFLSPGAALAQQQTPFAKNLAAQLQQLGSIGVHNQSEVIKILLTSLKQEGYNLELDPTILMPGSADSGVVSGLRTNMTPRSLEKTSRTRVPLSPLNSGPSVRAKQLKPVPFKADEAAGSIFG